MGDRPDLAEHALRRIAALRDLLTRLEEEDRSDDPAAQAVRELLAEATTAGDDAPDVRAHVRPS